MKKDKSFRTRIIGGEFKGKFIEIPNIQTTRSSKGILKESLFNTIQFEIIGKNFVEVFAGSGSIGLEALSRGAKRCYFMENSREAYKILEQNIKLLDPSRCYAVYGDSFVKFETILEIVKRDSAKTYFYFDPPFSIRDGMDEIYEKTISLIERIGAEICEMVVVEHMSSIDMPKKIGELEQIKRKKFGRSTMSYYLPPNKTTL